MSDGLSIFGAAGDAEGAGAPEAEGAAASEPADTAPEPAPGPTRRPRWPGGVATGLAILMVLSWAGGLALLSAGLFELGVGLTGSAFLLSGLAIIAGIVAAIGNWGRGWGIAGAAIGVLLNPLLVLLLLSWLGAL